MRSIAVLALVVLVIVTPTAAVAQDGCTPPLVTDAAGSVALHGAGMMSTRPFDLGGGAYTVRWQATNPTAIGRTLMLHLKRADDPSPLGQIIAGHQIEQATVSGETSVYGVKPGTYYLEVTAPGAWAITVTPH